mgnify:CR=1 FL=1
MLKGLGLRGNKKTINLKSGIFNLSSRKKNRKTQKSDKENVFAQILQQNSKIIFRRFFFLP